MINETKQYKETEQLLLNHGFSKAYLINNRGLIMAVIDVINYKNKVSFTIKGEDLVDVISRKRL